MNKTSIPERTTEERVARADAEIANALTFSANQTPATPLGERIGGLQWELDARNERAAALGEPVMRTDVGQARRVIVTPELIASTNAMMRRAGERAIAERAAEIERDRVSGATALRESWRNSPAVAPLQSMSTEDVRAEQRKLHERLRPMLDRYVAAENGPAQLAVLKEMGGDLPRYRALGDELAERQSRELRQARMAQEAQMGLSY